eukprot:1512803-Rhodomonas_salina.4
MGYQTCSAALAGALNDEKLDASILFCGIKGSSGYEITRAGIEADLEYAQKNRYPRWNILVGLVLWLVSMLSYLDNVPWVTARVDSQIIEGFKYAGLLALALTFGPIALKATSSLRHASLDINILMTIAVIGACGLQQFSEAAAIAVLFSISDWLEMRATSRAREAVAAILSLRPELAELPDGTIVPAEVASAFLIFRRRCVPLSGPDIGYAAARSVSSAQSLSSRMEAKCPSTALSRYVAVF